MCVDLESGIVASKLELEVGSMSLSSPPCLSAVFEDVSTGTGESSCPWESNDVLFLSSTLAGLAGYALDPDSPIFHFSGSLGAARGARCARQRAQPGGRNPHPWVPCAGLCRVIGSLCWPVLACAVGGHVVAESRRSKGYPILQYVRLTGRSAPRCGGVYGSVHKVVGFGVWFKQGFSPIG